MNVVDDSGAEPVLPAPRTRSYMLTTYWDYPQGDRISAGSS